MSAIDAEGAHSMRWTYAINQRISNNIVVVGQLRQSKTALLLQRRLKVGGLVWHDDDVAVETDMQMQHSQSLARKTRTPVYQ